MSDSWAARLAARTPAEAKDPGGPVLVVSAHPDDEVLAVGAWLAAQSERDLTFVTATDGEASHPSSRTCSPEDLRRLRSKELLVALGELGIGAPAVHRLGIPDGCVAEHRTRLADALGPFIERAAVVLAPYAHDGHPDHDAVGQVAAELCGTDQTLWQMPIWTWAWTEPGSGPWFARARSLPSDPMDRVRKWRAIDAFTTQVRPLSPALEDRPVVSGLLLEHAITAPEVVIV